MLTDGLSDSKSLSSSQAVMLTDMLSDSSSVTSSQAVLDGCEDGQIPAAAVDGLAGDVDQGLSSAQPPPGRKIKKREDARGLDHVLKALQSLQTTDEKLSVLSKKYAELLEEHKTLQNSCRQNQRTLSVLSREKDQLQSEHSKSVLAKSKLESLCRELQRQNKLVKDESITRAKEDEEKRKEVTNKFQLTINDIQQQMNDHYGKNMALREENIELANKLKGLIEQYELREAQIDKVFKSKDLESQLYDARLQQAALQINEEKEKHLQDKQQLLRDAMESQQKIMLLEEQEKALKAQVAMYSEKYEDFQSTLTRSNDVFSSFKGEMEKMSKKIKKLEKDTVMWKEKWENSNKSLLLMAEQKAHSDKQASLLQNKVSKLESLCRALQEERKQANVNNTVADFPLPNTLSGDRPASSISSTTPDSLETRDDVTRVPEDIMKPDVAHVPKDIKKTDNRGSQADVDEPLERGETGKPAILNGSDEITVVDMTNDISQPVSVDNITNSTNITIDVSSIADATPACPLDINLPDTDHCLAPLVNDIDCNLSSSDMNECD